MFTAIATSIAAATDLSAFGAGAVFVVVGLLVIIAGYTGAVAADNPVTFFVALDRVVM